MTEATLAQIEEWYKKESPAADAKMLSYIPALLAMARDNGRLRELNARWNKAINPLTAMGSEFVDAPERCAENIRSNQEFAVRLKDKKIQTLTAERDRLAKVLKWYATANYERGEALVEHGQVYGYSPSEVYEDAGQRARTAVDAWDKEQEARNG